MVFCNQYNTSKSACFGSQYDLLSIKVAGIECLRIRIAISPFFVFKSSGREVNKAINFRFVPCYLPGSGECAVRFGWGLGEIG